MRMPPGLERPSHLFVAELPSPYVTVMARFPSHPQRSHADGEHDATAVLQSAGLALDADESAGRKQVHQRVRPLMPAKQINRRAWHDGAVREERTIGGCSVGAAAGMPRDSFEQTAENQVVDRKDRVPVQA